MRSWISLRSIRATIGHGSLSTKFPGRRNVLFTVTLADRRSRVLVENIDLLRRAFRTTRRECPFSIDAVIVLPDHLHIAMTLPPMTPISPDAGAASKVYSHDSSSRAAFHASAMGAANTPCGKDDFGSTPSATNLIWCDTSITFTTIRSSTISSRKSAIGRTRLFIAMCGLPCCRQIGRELMFRPTCTLASELADPGFRFAPYGLRSTHPPSSDGGGMRVSWNRRSTIA